MRLFKAIFAVLLFLATLTIQAQIGIGTTTPAASSKLDVTSTTSGFLAPRMTTSQKNAINSPAIGLMVYQTDSTAGFYYYEGTSWNLLASSTRGIPYSGATGAVNLGAYDLTVNGLTVGHGGGGLSSNTAIGYQSLTTNSLGDYNTTNGYQTLYYNTTGSYNTATGHEALYSNTTGGTNTATGLQALYSNTTGSQNTANGNYALYSNTTGYANTANGAGALYDNNTGINNTALGHQAGSFITTGSNNTAIGTDAQVPTATASNQVRIGDANVTYAGVQVAWTITSDKRWKSNIQNSNLGLDFISKLRPVSYFRNNDESKKLEYGFIAQELEEALNHAGVTNNGIVSKDSKGMYGVRYNDLMAPMVKAIQEQQTIIEAQQKQIDELKQLVETLIKK
jgi:trimeric autotransporter adhesin